jgi:hypothetical protein
MLDKKHENEQINKKGQNFQKENKRREKSLIKRLTKRQNI